MAFREEKFLLIPGPTELSPSVIRAMGHPIIAHYMDQWMAVYNETIDMLKRVLQTKNDVFVITGSGTASLEAAVCSIVEPGDKVLVDHPIFGDLVKAHGGIPIEIPVKFGDHIDPSDVERRLEQEKDVKAVAIIHNNTFSAVTNPIHEIGKVVYDFGPLFIIDAISSLGGIEIKTDEWHVDIVCSAGQKALAIPPGIAPTSVSAKAWEVMEKRKEPIHSKYLNLLEYKNPPIDRERKWHPTPFTPSTVLFRALWQSLKDLLQEGMENVYRRHAIAAEAAREGFKAMGLELLVKDERYASNTVTAVLWPHGYDHARFWRILYDEFNIMIGNPPEHQPMPDRKIFRMAHMGNTATPECILMGLSYIERALNMVNFNTKGGEGVAAAQRVFLHKGLKVRGSP